MRDINRIQQSQHTWKTKWTINIQLTDLLIDEQKNNWLNTDLNEFFKNREKLTWFKKLKDIFYSKLYIQLNKKTFTVWDIKKFIDNLEWFNWLSYWEIIFMITKWETWNRSWFNEKYYNEFIKFIWSNWFNLSDIKINKDFKKTKITKQITTKLWDIFNELIEFKIYPHNIIKNVIDKINNEYKDFNLKNPENIKFGKLIEKINLYAFYKWKDKDSIGNKLSLFFNKYTTSEHTKYIVKYLESYWFDIWSIHIVKNTTKKTKKIDTTKTKNTEPETIKKHVEKISVKEWKFTLKDLYKNIDKEYKENLLILFKKTNKFFIQKLEWKYKIWDFKISNMIDNIIDKLWEEKCDNKTYHYIIEEFILNTEKIDDNISFWIHIINILKDFWYMLDEKYHAPEKSKIIEPIKNEKNWNHVLKEKDFKKHKTIRDVFRKLCLKWVWINENNIKLELSTELVLTWINTMCPLYWFTIKEKLLLLLSTYKELKSIKKQDINEFISNLKEYWIDINKWNKYFEDIKPINSNVEFKIKTLFWCNPWRYLNWNKIIDFLDILWKATWENFIIDWKINYNKSIWNLYDAILKSSSTDKNKKIDENITRFLFLKPWFNFEFQKFILKIFKNFWFDIDESIVDKVQNDPYLRRTFLRK